MEKSQAIESHTFRGQESPRTSVTTNDLVDFCQAYALKHPVKKVQADTGLSKKQVENIRQGISSVSGVTLSRWIMNDPCFGGKYCEWVGLIRPGEARTAHALTLLVNSVVQREVP